MSVVANVAVNVDARQATQNLKRLEQESKKAANSIQTTGKRAASATANIQRFGIAFRAVLGPLVAVTGAVNLLGGSLRVLGERQADAAALENGLKKIGGTAGDLKRLQVIADQLGKQTLFNQEDFSRGFTLLTSFQSIGVASYERVAKAAADVAQVTRQDVNSSLMQLAKALQDPEKGLTALARSGTQFTESQKAQVEQLVKSGQQLKAQDFILKEIERQYGNAAAAAGSAGYAGAVDSLQESFRDFQERLATGVEPAVAGTLKALTDLFDLVSKIPEPVGRAALAIGSVTAAVVALRAGIVLLLPKLKALFALALANPWIALAAGITAATIALAGYRTEAQRLSGAAESGDEESINAARTRLATVREEIGALQSRDKLTRGQSRKLQRLRDQERLLVSGITAGTAAALTAPTPKVDIIDPPGGGGGGRAGRAGGDSAAREADRAAESAARELARVENIVRNRLAEGDVIRLNSELQERIAAADSSRDSMLSIRLRGVQKELGIQQQYARELAQETDTRAQQAIIYKGNVELVANQRETERILAAEQLKIEQERLNSMQKFIEQQYALNTAAQQQLDLTNSIADTLGRGMTSAFDSLIQGSENWGASLRKIASGVLIDIANQLLRIFVIEQAINAIKGVVSSLLPFSAATPLGAGGGTIGRFGTLGPNFGIPQRAKGGPVSARSPYIVGERGPELFVPGRSGTVIPNDKMGGSGINVSVNVDASGSKVEGDEQEGRQLGRVIAAAIQQELIKQKRPGGLLT